MRFDRRLARLERDAADAEPRPTCPECGCRRGSGQPQQIRVVWEEEEDPGPERCPGCGRVRVVQVAFDDAG